MNKHIFCEDLVLVFGEEREAKMGVLFQIYTGKDKIGPYTRVKILEPKVFEDYLDEIYGRSGEDDHGEFSSVEEEKEAWDLFLKGRTEPLTLLSVTDDGFIIYKISDKHFEKVNQLSTSPSDFYFPGMDDPEEIEKYLQGVELDVLGSSELNLRKAYYQTTFSIPELKIDLMLKEVSPDLEKFLIENNLKTYCFITAWNPASEMQEEEANKKLNEKLLNNLKEYKVYKGLGIPKKDSGWPSEESFIIFDIDESDAVELMEKYGQKAIVFGGLGNRPYLIYNEEIENLEDEGDDE